MAASNVALVTPAFLAYDHLDATQASNASACAGAAVAAATRLETTANNRMCNFAKLGKFVTPQTREGLAKGGREALRTR